MAADRAASYSSGDRVFTSNYGFGHVTEVNDDGVLMIPSRENAFGSRFVPFESVEQVGDEEFPTYKATPVQRQYA